MISQPPKEEKKATPYHRVGIRPFNVGQVCDPLLVCQASKVGRKKSHLTLRIRMPPSSTSRTPTSCIEQPNSNATIRSGFFFFLRGPRPQGLDYDSIKIKIQNPELEIQNSKIKDQRSKIKIKSSEIKIQITISKIKNHKIPNPKFIIPNPKSKVKYQKSKPKYL